MMNKTFKYLIALLVASVFIGGCKITKDTNAMKLKMPLSYGSAKDSLNSADINWKEYFSDTVLIHLIENGIKNNFDLLSAVQKLEIARSYVGAAKGSLLPAVNANAGYLQRKFGLYTMDGAGNITTEITPGQIVPIHLPDYYVGLQTAWEVDIWRKLRNRKKAALSRYLASIEAKNLVITTLVADICGAYYQLLELDNELEIIRETIKLQENAVELITFQKQATFANELAVGQFKALLLNSKALEYEILQRITENENRINFLLGRYPQKINRNKENFNKPFAASVRLGIPSHLLRNRPDVRKAELELIASKADLGAARAAFYPSLNITGSMGLQSFNTKFFFQTPESIAYSLLGNLVAPLINRAAIKAEFNRANATQQEALLRYQESVLNGYIEVYNEAARIKNLDSVIAFKAGQVDVLSKSAESASELFTGGRANYIEVLMSQKNTLEAKLELLDAKNRKYYSIINIYKALGGGWK